MKRKGIYLWYKYHDIHGSAEKFRSFFQDYLKKEEKVKLMKSVQFFKKETREFTPLFCYNGEKCNFQFHHCNFDSEKEKCPAYRSDDRLKRGIKEFANFLYHLRSKYVHEATAFVLSEKMPLGIAGYHVTYDYVKYKFIYMRKGYEHKGAINLTLFIEMLEEKIDKNLKIMLDNYLKMMKGETN